MILFAPIQPMFNQLSYVLESLSNDQYTRPCNRLSGASIGQHVRHIIELYIELGKGYESGMVNYENRERNHAIETDKAFAVQQMNKLIAEINKPDKPLLLVADYGIDEKSAIVAASNYNRELLYNIEHTVHHMALIRIGITELSSLSLPTAFGVAVSTIRYRKTICAQ